MKLILAILMTPLMAFAQSGGSEGTGGGNASAARPTDRARIEMLIAFVPQILNPVLRNLESRLKADRKDTSALQLADKVFGQKPNIYDALNAARFSKQPGPCRDSNGAETDASAINAPNYCFSTDRLTNRLTDATAEREIFALAVHELSHSVGTNEQEARLLQTMVRSKLPIAPIQQMGDADVQFNVKRYDAMDAAERAEAELTKNNQVQFCIQLTRLGSALESADTTAFTTRENLGMNILPSASLAALWGALVKVANLSSACGAEEPTKAELDKAFGSQKQITVTDFWAKIWSVDGLVPDELENTNWILRRVDDGNKTNLLAEIQNVNQLLNMIVMGK